VLDVHFQTAQVNESAAYIHFLLCLNQQMSSFFYQDAQCR
jgi:hypothetical protein